MSELKDITRRLIGEKAILDGAIELNRATRTEAEAVFDPGDRKDLGALGMVYMTKPNATWRVTDRAALQGWLVEHAPQYLTERVVVEYSPAAVLDALEDGMMPNSDGEMVVPSGVELVKGRPSLMVKVGPEARAAAGALVKAIVNPELEK